VEIRVGTATPTRRYGEAYAEVRIVLRGGTPYPLGLSTNCVELSYAEVRSVDSFRQRSISEVLAPTRKYGF